MFDKALRQGRVKIENYFAQLKNMWHILKKLNFTVSYAGQITTVCCVLHNFCKIYDDGLVDGNNEVDDHQNHNDLKIPRGRRDTEIVSKAISFRIRDALYNEWVSNIIQ